MPNPNERLLRLIVPVVLAIAGIGVAASFFVNSRPSTPPNQPGQHQASQNQPANQSASNQSGTEGTNPSAGQGATQPGGQSSATDPNAQPAPGTPSAGTGTTNQPSASPTTAEGSPSTAPATPTVPASTLRVLPSGEDPASWRAIGAPLKLDEDGRPTTDLLDESSPFEFRISFSAYGAGIDHLLLSDYHTTWQATHSQPLQETREWTETLALPDGTTSTRKLAASPFAAQQVVITDGGVRRTVVLWQSPTRENVWRQTDAADDYAVFEATIVEEAPATAGSVGASGSVPPTGTPEAPGAESPTAQPASEPRASAPLLRVVRRYQLSPGSYVIAVTQTIENLSARPLEVQFLQFGPIDLAPDHGGGSPGYGGDKRRVRFGYLSDPSSDPTQQFVVADSNLRQRASVKSAYDAALQRQQAAPALWPTDHSVTEQQTLVWAGLTNRYFGVATHTLIDPPAAPTGGTASLPDKALRPVERVDALFAQASATRTDDVMAMRLTLAPVTLAPGASSRTEMGLFAGPLSRPVINEDPRARIVNLAGLVVYNFGGWCGGCTFSWLTDPLIALLRVIHDYITQDWALAIIVLVFIVRGVLHPVQQWSQIRTQRFAKQMQNLGPKQKKLQERYKDDKARLQQETAKLWREEGITPASFVGCIPPFLQSPIWIALSAMIYFAVELRHEAAFFGVFQTIAPGWSFMSDLSEPDKVIDFGTPFSIPVLSWIMGPIGSVNILPFLLALVFYSHQKYFTPPTTATMTPEQQQAQMISKWMMVVMFPVMMYSAPAGFTLYFIANSTIAIFQTRWIKSYIEKHDLDNPERARAKAAKRRSAVANSDSFLARMAKRVEEAQKARQGAQPGPGKAMQRRPDARREAPKRFKDR